MPTPTFNILCDVKIFFSVCNELRDFFGLSKTLVCSIRAELDVDICITDTLFVDPLYIEGFHSTSNPRARTLCSDIFANLGVSVKEVCSTFFCLLAVISASALKVGEVVCVGSILPLELLCSSITSHSHDLISASFAANVTLIFPQPG